MRGDTVTWRQPACTSSGYRRRPIRPSPPARLGQRVLGDVDGGEGRVGAVAGEDDGLRADAAARLQYPAAGRIAGVGVQQLGEGGGLVGEPGALPGRVAVDVADRHPPEA